MSRRNETKTSGAVTPAIVTAIVGGIVAIVVAYINVYVPYKFAIATTQTAEAKQTLVASLVTLTSTATSTPESTLTSMPTSTPPPPLVEIFSQVGDGEAFLFFPKDKPELIKKEFTQNEDCSHSGPYGLRLIYNFIGGGDGGWGVDWQNAPMGGFVASSFTNLTFWVKGATGKEKFHIGLKDTDNKEVKIESETVAPLEISTWTQITIPLNKFRGVKTDSINNVNFGFNKEHGAGSICIDDIAFK